MNVAGDRPDAVDRLVGHVVEDLTDGDSPGLQTLDGLLLDRGFPHQVELTAVMLVEVRDVQRSKFPS